jgi:hypothetical protein
VTSVVTIGQEFEMTLTGCGRCLSRAVGAGRYETGEGEKLRERLRAMVEPLAGRDAA